jgi:type II secretory pathway predicted ATPase ExeA/cell division septation protein DedD
MFKDFYHLKSEPFSTHPDPSVIFISQTHKEAWYYLLFCIKSQEPFVVLTGEYGVGKTLLCLRLVEALKNKGEPLVEYIPTPYERYNGILRRIAFRMGISPVSGNVDVLLEMIYDQLRSNVEKVRFYLIIDDAHELNISTLTKLKHLSTFSHNGVFPFVMIFVAHPSFLKDMKSPAIISLNQRIKRRYHLSRLNYEDTKEYIYFRLLKSGSAGIPLFSEDAHHKINEYSGGVPRLINNICDTCLLIAASKEFNTISADVVDEARQLVESGLMNSEARTESDVEVYPNSINDYGTFISISEDMPTVDQEASVPILLDDPVDTQLEEPSGINKKLRKIIIIASVTILLTLSGAVLFMIFMDDIHVPFFFAFSGHQMEQTKTDNHLPQYLLEAGKEQSLPQNLPALREELIVKPTAGITANEPQSDAMKIDLVDAQLQAPSRMDFQPSSKTEFISPESSERNIFYPYSLRVSSYKRLSLALDKISDIKQKELSPYLVKVDLGNMGVLWRIYIGQYASEEEARSARKNYNQPNVSVQKIEYACLVGEYSNHADMSNMFSKLNKSEYFPYIIQKGRDRFCLYLGAYKNKPNAEAFHGELQKKGINSQVVRR